MNTEKTDGARVFLIDDHPAMRNGLSLLLKQAGHVVCGEAENKAETLARIEAARADVALVDLSLGEGSGLDLIEDLRASNVAAIIYSMHDDRKTIERSFERGASGYVTKREVAEVLLAALDEVRAGGRYASPGAMKSLAGRFIHPDEEGESSLSQREEQIVAKLARAETSAEIAKSLHISTHTVKTYYTRIITKLGLEGMKELRKFAAQVRK